MSQEPTQEPVNSSCLAKANVSRGVSDDEHRSVEQADVIGSEDDRTGTRNVCFAVRWTRQ